MGNLLFIPWFRLDPIDVPLTTLLLGLLAVCGLAAVNPRWRAQAISTGFFVTAAGLFAFFADFEIIPVQPFGILVATGVVLGTKYSEWYAKKHDIDPITLGDFVTHVVGIGFIFAMLLNAIFYETDSFVAFLSDPSNNMRWMGLSSYGGFLGAIFGVWVWKKRNPELKAWPLADAVCFGLPLGWFFGRMGCFVVHDHPGRETDFFLGIENYYEQGIVRHDLGFYEVLHAGLLIVLFYVIMTKRPKPERPMGLWIALLPLLYTPVRFFLDFLRATDLSSSDVRYSGLTPAQYASIGMFVMSVFLLRRVMQKPEWDIPSGMRFSTRRQLRAAAENESAEEQEREAKDEAKESPKSSTGKSSSAKKRKKKK